MTTAATLTLRRAELARRVELLPAEVSRWKTRTSEELDMNAHFSQLQAIELLIDTLVDKQRELLAALDTPVDDFGAGAFELVLEIIKTQRVWDFFRDKLELRFAPDFKDALWAADTVAWDCHRPVLDRAVEAGIVPAAHVREPPLTYLSAEFSPATWVRGSRPNDGRDHHLGAARLPVPVIEFPWDHVGNLWELVSLQHEVGHDLEIDLALRPHLMASLQTTLEEAGVPPERVATWVAWEGEIVADLIGLQLGGPAFSWGLMHLLVLSKPAVVTFDPGDPHPTHYVRILMNAAYIPTLVPGLAALTDDAAALESTWKGLYGEVAEFAPFEADFPHVFRGLMDTEFPALAGKTLRELMPYAETDDGRIRQAAGFLRTGQNAPAPLSMPPRHVISAARLAAQAAIPDAGAAGDSGDVPEALEAINGRVVQLVRAQAAPGLRASDDSDPHKAFVAGFAALL